MSNPGKDTTRKENYSPMSLMDMFAKILNKMLTNQIKKCIKRIIYHDQLRFICMVQGWFNVCKVINMVEYISKMRNRNDNCLIRDEFDNIEQI